MKYLLILLLSFNSFADVRVVASNNNGAIYQAEFETIEKAQKWVDSNAPKGDFGLNERWVEKVGDLQACLETREIKSEVDDLSIPYPDPIPEDYRHPQVEIVVRVECKLDYEYRICGQRYKDLDIATHCEDITAEVNAEKAKKEKDAQDAAAIDAKLLDGSAKLEDVINILKIMRGL